MQAARSGETSDAVEKLLEAGTSTTEDLSARSPTGYTAVFSSAMNSHAAVAHALVKHGADVNTVHDLCGATPLHVASQQGHISVMKVFLDAGANLDARMGDGQTTPLFLALFYEHSDAFRFLLRRKANTLLKFNGGLPLEAACTLDRVQMVRDLIQHVGIARCGGPTEGRLALTSAAKQQNIDVMSILSEAGVEDKGWALCVAVEYGREDSVKFLLHKAGDDAMLYATLSCDNDGWPPLRICLRDTSLKLFSCRIVRMLLDTGLDVQFAVGGNIAAYITVITSLICAKKKSAGNADEKVIGLEAIRRLILQEGAVRASSWGWPSTEDAAQGTSSNGTTSAVLKLLRRKLRPWDFATAVDR